VGVGRGKASSLAIKAVFLAMAAAAAVSASIVAADAPAGSDEPLPGRALYEQYCVHCHGAEGKGDGPAGLPAVPMPRDFTVGAFKFDADADGRTGTDRDLFLVIRDGAAVYGGSPLMAGWGHLGEERIRALLDHVRSLQRRSGKGQ
jgi:hypothetical protein